MPSAVNTAERLDLPGRNILPAVLRRELRRQVLAVLSHSGPATDYDAPKGDPGLFGPDTAVWKIHADFPSMMAGGLAALMIQTLHPLALAGVWDHSTFREDTLGRLQRTTAFVSRTTFAPRAPAEQAIARVREIHHQVTGTAPDGRPYSADDPLLLTWVHCAEVWAFLRAYEMYCQPVPAADQDRYLSEVAYIAEALGARDVPKNVVALDDFFARMRPQLEVSERTRDVLAVLDAIQLPIPLPGVSRSFFLHAGSALLPAWVDRLLGRTAADRAKDRVAAVALRTIAPSIREALARGGLAWRSCARVGARYEDLFRWGRP